MEKIDLSTIQTAYYLRTHLPTGVNHVERFNQTHGYMQPGPLVTTLAQQNFILGKLAAWNRQHPDMWAYRQLTLGEVVQRQEDPSWPTFVGAQREVAQV